MPTDSGIQYSTAPKHSLAPVTYGLMLPRCRMGSSAACASAAWACTRPTMPEGKLLCTRGGHVTVEVALRRNNVKPAKQLCDCCRISSVSAPRLTCTRLRMPSPRLGCHERQRGAAGGAALHQCGSQRAHLNWVSQRSAYGNLRVAWGLHVTVHCKCTKQAALQPSSPLRTHFSHLCRASAGPSPQWEAAGWRPVPAEPRPAGWGRWEQ